MFMKDLTSVPADALPVAELRDHLRLGTGFADIAAQDVALMAYVRAAMAAIEARTQKILLSRDILIGVTRWNGASCALPIAPISAVNGLSIVAGDGTETVLDPSRYRLVADLSRPRIEARGSFPEIGPQGHAQINVTAGFGAAWSDLPADLQQAVLMLSAQYYDLRHDGAGDVAAMPFGVAALIEGWRTVRILGASPGGRTR